MWLDRRKLRPGWGARPEKKGAPGHLSQHLSFTKRLRMAASPRALQYGSLTQRPLPILSLDDVRDRSQSSPPSTCILTLPVPPGILMVSGGLGSPDFSTRHHGLSCLRPPPQCLEQLPVHMSHSGNVERVNG